MTNDGKVKRRSKLIWERAAGSELDFTASKN